nr:uncharacterized protein CTRU02_00308 [Colletotrichum truncatum]KAF6801559.1 hypothetical protein CTRU02_00308 [Colletotrichum truncatum]
MRSNLMIDYWNCASNNANSDSTTPNIQFDTVKVVNVCAGIRRTRHEIINNLESTLGSKANDRAKERAVREALTGAQSSHELLKDQYAGDRVRVPESQALGDGDD